MISPHAGVIGPVMGQGAVDVSGQVRMIMPDAGVQDPELNPARVLPSFMHPNGIKMQGTREARIDVREVFNAMRKRVRGAGLPGLYIIACGDNGPRSQERFKAEGYDAISAYNYASAGATSRRSPYRSLMKGHVPIWDKSLDADILRYIPLLTVGWDSRPWHGEDAAVRFNRTTEFFREGLMALKKWMDKNNAQIGLLEAWNEWGEGSYIEPNAEFGFGDVEAIRNVFAKPGDWPRNIAPSDVGLGPYHISALNHELSE